MGTPQPMRVIIIRQRGWRTGVCPRLGDTWFGVPALLNIAAVKLKRFQPAQSYQGKVSVMDDEST